MRRNNTSKRSILLAAITLLGLLSPMANAGEARCFLHGIITPVGDKEKSSLSDMIRLHFDAADKAKCEQMISAYCQYQVKDKNYSPGRLKGSFKVDVEKSEEVTYTLSEKCKVVSDD